MTRTDVEAELRRRGTYHLAQSHLLVDYYRIRRKLNFELPVCSLQLPDWQIPGVPVYPWAIWLAWAMEERILCLGWCAELWRDDGCRAAAERDLMALAQWPVFRQYDFVDLGMAHNCRILWTAATRWNWLSPELLHLVRGALERIVADGLPRHLEHYGANLKAAEILSGPDPDRALHNVALIGSLGLALAASATTPATVSTTDERQRLNTNLEALVEALLELRDNGHSEGVSYDGYVLDFVCDWASTLPELQCQTLFGDARWDRYLQEFIQLGAPGNLLNIAPIGDVESEAMPFQVSGQIKLQALDRPLHRQRPLVPAERQWYLDQFEAPSLRVDALAAWFTEPTAPLDPYRLPTPEPTPPESDGDAQYARVLRTGYGAEDICVVVSASNCPLAHLPASYGSLCIGSAGHWFIQTPGYQQYMPTSERAWTNGATARNTPILDGQATTLKLGSCELDGSASQLTCDIGACYSPETNVELLYRQVQLRQHDRATTIQVTDHLKSNAATVQYCWHCDVDAAWWLEDGRARIYLGGRTLWVWSPQCPLQFADLHRLRGSRGPLALNVTIPCEKWRASGKIEWFFCMSESAPPTARTYD